MGFTQKIDPEVSHSYDGIIKQLDGESRAAFAEVILEVLESTGDSIVAWRGMNDQQVEAAMELIALTHVAEGAVPQKEEVKNTIMSI